MKQRIIRKKGSVNYAFAIRVSEKNVVRKGTKYNEHVAPRMTEKQIVRELCRGWLWG